VPLGNDSQLTVVLAKHHSNRAIKSPPAVSSRESLPSRASSLRRLVRVGVR
jgi:hypothetical protein